MREGFPSAVENYSCKFRKCSGHSDLKNFDRYIRDD